jgi:nucleotide-binding universal stress UspA family protein
VTAGDDMARTILDLSRELKITLLALGEPGEKARAELVRRVLSRILAASTAPVLFVPAGAREARDSIRRILLVLHLPYPATDLVDLAIPLARRTHAEILILALPSAKPFIPDCSAAAADALAFKPFDAETWLERECARHGCRTRPVSADGKGVDVILERAAALEADLVVAGAQLAELRVGWRRRKALELLFPRFPCPLLLGRPA